MKRAVVLLILLLAGAMVPATVMAEEAIATIHITAGQSKTAQIPHAVIEYNGEFWWDSGKICARIHVVYDNGGDHGVCARPSGETDPEKLYKFKLEHITYRTWSSTEGLSIGDNDAMNVFRVTKIDLLFHTVTIEGLQDDFKVGLGEGQTVTVPGVPKAEVKLVSISVGILETTAKFEITYSQPTEADIVVYPYEIQEQAPEPAPAENQTNESSKIPPLNLSTPTAMIVVGEHAAGADVAAGAKVGIAVQKWIDIIKEKGGEIAVPELGKLSGLIAKAVTAPVQNLNADAMLDTEVKDPKTIAPIVYTVGGPAANQYTAQILASRDDLPVKFVKENGKWYLMSKFGDKWEGSYGVILIIPAAKDVFELQQRMVEGKIKVADVVVAGLDRKGTYAACDLLQGEFMKPILGEKPRPELEYFIEIQGRALMLFSQNPLEAFTITIDPNNPFKLQTTAIIVDKNGKIVKVVSG